MRAEQVLPDDMNQGDFNGVAVRKGTVGAFLASTKVWLDPLTPAAEKKTAERDIIDALPALRALGIFDILQIRNDALRKFIEAH